MAETGSGLRRECLRAQLRCALAERIIAGAYPPGHRLVELQIAREFQTSQGPVREALRELEALGLVESETYRGTRVRSITEAELFDTAAVRGALEREASGPAAAKLAGNVAPLRAACDAIEAAAAARDFDAYARHNADFHRAIVAAAGNPVLLRVWDGLALDWRSRVALRQLRVNLPAVAASHRPIADALDRGDAPTAGRLLRAHATWLGWDDPTPTPA